MSLDIEIKKKDQLNEFLSGQLAVVNVSGIEGELRKLWSMAETSHAGEGRSVARACTLNLIVYGEPEEENEVSLVIDDITVWIPCRVILATTKDSQEEKLDSWVSARCHLAGANMSQQICCEQITVKYEGSSVNALPSVVTPLLLSDMPVFLWWRSSQVQQAKLEAFLNPRTSRVDRVIFDSQRKGVNAFFFEEMLLLLTKFPGSLDICDSNWLRLKPWRTVMAHAFDGYGDGLEVGDLQHINKLTMTVSGNVQVGTVEQSSQALLTLGWLVTSLGWKLENLKTGSGNIVASGQFSNNQGYVGVSILIGNCQNSLGAGSLQELVLEFNDGRKLRLSLCASTKAEFLDVQLIDKGGKPIDRRINIRPMTEAQLVCEELTSLVPETIYESSLVMVTQLAKLLEKK